MSLVRVGSLDDVRPGGTMEFRQGGTELAICNVEGQVYAIDNRCPHRGGPLAMGALHGTHLVCPWHAWEFDCTTGICDRNPAVVLRGYDVHVAEDQSILVQLD